MLYRGGDTMRWLIRNLKIRAKLYLLAGLMLVGMLAVGVLSLLMIGRMNDETAEISDVWLNGVNESRMMNTIIADFCLNELRYVTATSDEKREASSANMAQLQSEMDALLLDYEKTLMEGTDRTSLEQAKKEWGNYLEIHSHLLRLGQQGRFYEARSVLDEEGKPAYDILSATFQEMTDASTMNAEQAKLSSERVYQYMICIMAVLIVALAVIGILLAMAVTRGVQAPVAEIEKAAIEMAKGNLDIEIRYQSRDELGVLSDQVRELVRKLRAIIEDENAFLAGMAAGDFTVRIPAPKRMDEIGSLIESFNTMTRELGSVEMLRSNFVSDISHEFKTPLTAIEGYAKLLEGDCSPEERREYVGTITDETRRLSVLVANILMINRLDKGNIPSERHPVRIDEQIRHALALCEAGWTGKNLELDLELDEIYFAGYESLLMQVWANLIDNAVKFSPDGGRISLALHQKGERVVFVICNDGDNIPEESRPHLFEQFYKADPSRGGEGNGLGLSIVKRVAELHGGEVSVENLPGSGVRFTIFL